MFTTDAQVEVFRDGTSIGFATPNDTLGANFTDTTTPADGTYAYTARMTDAAGNVGTLSAAFTIMIDTTP